MKRELVLLSALGLALACEEQTAEQVASAELVGPEYTVHQVGESPTAGYQVDHPLQDMGLRFVPSGLEVRSRWGSGWTFRMELVEFGDGNSRTPVPPATPRATKNRVDYQRGQGVKEWYLHDPRGVEQGFRIEAPPSGRPGRGLVLAFQLTGVRRATVSEDATSATFHLQGGAAVVGYTGLAVVDANRRALPAVLRADARVLTIEIDDRDAHYPVDIDPIISVNTKVLASDGEASDFLGSAVALDGDTLVVGARGDDDLGSAAGAAYVFQKDAGGADNWGQVAKLTASNGTAGDAFGTSVAISGDTVVVGAPNKATSTGAAYVFQRNQGGVDAWGQAAALTASGGASADAFGTAVAISADTVVVGAPGNDAAAYQGGAAYVFQEGWGGAGSWGQVARMTATNATYGDAFGQAVGVSGNQAVVGAPLRELNLGYAVISNSGAMYVFRRDQGGTNRWGQVTMRLATNMTGGERLGSAVAISGGLMVAGAPQSSWTGAAFVFNDFGQLAKLVPDDGVSGDAAGTSVAVAGELVVVGSPANWVATHASAGAAYVFRKDQGGLGAWGQSFKLTAFDPARYDSFGGSVSVSGERVALGSAGDDDLGSSSGSAYLLSVQDQDGDGDPDQTDCDPLDATIHHGAAELPDDGVDQDCSGTDTVTCYVDADQDGFGNSAGTTTLAADGLCDTSQGESTNATDACDLDPAKTEAGVCGCGVADADTDGDGTADCHDACPSDPEKITPGVCGCNAADSDSDGDGSADCVDACPSDPGKITPGLCGCNVADTDSDGDGSLDCHDACPSDPQKTALGVCGCGVVDTDSDQDGTPDCADGCPADPGKIAPGACGCGVAETDADGDGDPDCTDGCPGDPGKIAPGACGCGVAETDADGDGHPDCADGCPTDPEKVAPGACGCGVAETDADGDGHPDCTDGCPADPEKIAPGTCGCGVAESGADEDGDGTPDCLDGCPADANKTEPGACGCGVEEGCDAADGGAASDGGAIDPRPDGGAGNTNQDALGGCGCAGGGAGLPGPALILVLALAWARGARDPRRLPRAG